MRTTSTNRRARALVLTLAASSSCGGGTATSPDARIDEFDRQAMLANLATTVIIPGVERFDGRADALATAVDADCASSGDFTEGISRTAWRAAMTAWQEIEVVRVGPAALDSGALRDRIYSWPVVSSCAVDQEVLARWRAPDTYDLSTKLTNRRGLAALEYLLFAPSLESSCASAPAGWGELSDGDRRAARCGFAVAAAADLAVQSQALLDGWRPGAGDYAAVLAHAGDAGNPFRSAHEAVNRVSDGLFIVDADVKDMKLAEPAGITPGSCGTLGQPCPAELESPWSSHAKENILADLRGFRALFLGGDGPGFDDFLRARGAGDMATELVADLDAASAAVEAIPGTLAEAIVAAPAQVAAAHAAVKAVTDVLKSQFLTVLALELPADLGDDGD